METEKRSAFILEFSALLKKHGLRLESYCIDEGRGDLYRLIGDDMFMDITEIQEELYGPEISAAIKAREQQMDKLLTSLGFTKTPPDEK